MKSAVFGLLLCGLYAGASNAQTPPAGAQTPPPADSAPARLRVYLDCFDCFEQYLRDEIPWVDFVRQPQDADVHVLSSSNSTGGGGREVVLRFVGAGRFEMVDAELKAVSQTAEPENLRRARVLRTVEVGLLGYLARDGLLPEVDVDVSSPGGAGTVEPPADPWDLWVFRVSAGGSFDAEESNEELRWDLSLAADRVTEHWKIGVGASTDQQRERFDLDEDDPLQVHQHESEFDWFVAKSVGPHWSFGLDGRVASSTFGNTRFSIRSAPAVEFSIFPYREYATRQFVIQYEIGVERAQYTEVTLFDRLEETLWRHELSAELDQRQTWGSLQAGVEWSQYLHDASKYRLEVDGEISLRIVRGLSLDLDASASRIRDQISLPRRSASTEEVLLRLRELQSGYEVSVSAGISYSFGSLFNNVVNPRFGN